MKLLIVTQKVNVHDPILGFFVAWIREFAKHCESVTIICLEKGEFDLPQNCNVVSLGKESGASRLTYLYRFFKYSISQRRNYDTVFVHMNPIYVILGGIMWRLMGKNLGMWYTHKNVDLKLKIAEKIVDIIFSASSKSFRLETPKVTIMGHGIDTELFKPLDRSSKAPFKMISVGRISEVKNYGALVEVAKHLKTNNVPLGIELVGSPVTEADKVYAEGLKTSILTAGLEDMIIFKNQIVHEHVPTFVASADLFVNLSETGSLDKAVLEAMSCGIPVITSNEAFGEMLQPFGLMVSSKDPEGIARKISELLSEQTNRKELGAKLRALILQKHTLSLLIKNILQRYETSK